MLEIVKLRKEIELLRVGSGHQWASSHSKKSKRKMSTRPANFELTLPELNRLPFNFYLPSAAF